MKIEQINGDLLNRAVAIYEEHAYKNQPNKRRKFPVFVETESLDQILAKAHPFEDLSAKEDPTAAACMEIQPLMTAKDAETAPPRIYALRLGNSAYPHMKLAIVEAFVQGEFVFTVDRHDTFHFEPDVPGYDAWCELKEINRLLKESIEAAWDKATIPTLRALRKERFQLKDMARELRLEGRSILILDDDDSRGHIVKHILEEAGYTAMVGPHGPPPDRNNPQVAAALAKNDDTTLRLPASLTPQAGNVMDLLEIIKQRQVALIVLDVSYRTGQGVRVAGALKIESQSQELPILAIYSRRDFGPDPDLFNAALRRPYRAEALLSVIESLLLRQGGSSTSLRIVPKP